MYKHKAQYYETDQMGIVHHSNYIRWYEEARCNLLDEMGFSYDRMEEEGLLIPVLSVQSEYKSMVRFGDIVEIKAQITEFNGVKFTVEYQLTDNKTGELKNTGMSKHCFLNKEYQPILIKKTHPKIYEMFKEMGSL